MEIEFKNVSYTYQPNSPFSFQALKEVSLTIPTGSFSAIVGHTGSGKSTLLQHLNGLLRPTEGQIQIGEYTLAEKKSNQIKELRKEVGVVFQYPEHQLFEETVEKDILFGPHNFGMEVEKAKERLPAILEEVGLSEDILDRSPFELSGGQMRRVAIAGVLITDPKVLVLDEPTAGLDPKGRQQVMALVEALHKQKGITVVLVTHHMEDVLRYAENVFVLSQGMLAMEGTPTNVFSKRKELRALGLDLPVEMQFLEKLNETLGLTIHYHGQTAEELGQEIAMALELGGNQ